MGQRLRIEQIPMMPPVGHHAVEVGTEGIVVVVLQETPPLMYENILEAPWRLLR